jgi:2-methylcitrate dehydratase PrpD
MPDVNLQYILSVVLIDGDLSFEAGHSLERMHDPTVVGVKQRIRLVGDPDSRLGENDCWRPLKTDQGGSVKIDQGRKPAAVAASGDSTPVRWCGWAPPGA